MKCGSVLVKIYSREKRVGGRTYVAYEVADFTGGRRKMRGADWPKNGLRHSYISYRLAVTKDVAATAMEAGNSAPIIFKHYRELCKPDAGAAWFGIQPLDATSTNIYKGNA